MPSTHRPLLSLFAGSTLAVLAALSACDEPRSEEPGTRVIPPAAPYLAPIARAEPPPPPPVPRNARPGDARPEPDPEPSPAEVAAFERPVRK